MGLLYMLTFRQGGKRYIGITSKTMKRRLSLHLSHARTGRDCALHRAVRKYGDDSFEVRILLVADDWDYLCEIEKRAIVAFGTRAPHGYNITEGGEGVLGIALTPEQRAKLSAAKKGSNLGNKFGLGYRHTEEARAKISKAGIGRVFSDERRSKIGQSKIGNTYNVGRPCSPEKAARISATQKGRKMPEERRQKMIGQKRSAEARLRMSMAAKRRYAPLA